MHPPNHPIPPCRRCTLAATKRAQQDADEWAKIYAMRNRVGAACGDGRRAGPAAGFKDARQEAVGLSQRPGATCLCGTRPRPPPLPQEGKAQDEAERAAAHEAAARLQEELSRQVAAHAAARVREREEDRQYAKEEEVGGGERGWGAR
jgi:hypothetical protein